MDSGGFYNAQYDIYCFSPRPRRYGKVAKMSVPTVPYQSAGTYQEHVLL